MNPSINRLIHLIYSITRDFKHVIINLGLFSLIRLILFIVVSYSLSALATV